MSRIFLFAGGALALLIILFLLAGILILYGQNGELGQKYSSLGAQHNETLAEYSQLQQNYSALGRLYAQASSDLQAATISLSTANSEIARLNSQLAAEKQQLTESKASLEEQQRKAQQIATDLNSLEASVNKSMAWFSENAKLPENCTWDKDTCWKSDTFRKRVASDCVDKGQLNLACISYLMEHTTFSIHYRTDIEKGSEDHLQGVKETMQVGSGDCEDYSLIFKAILNTANEDTPGLVAVTYTGGTEDFRVYPKESTPYNEIESYWYVPKAKSISLGNLSSAYPYVICYSLTAEGGHCTVALSPHKLTGSADIYSLNGAQVFEPQIGQYIGTVGSNGPVLCTSQQDCFGRTGQIRIVIADSDLYSFENGKWVSYADYLGRVESAKTGIEG